jgi:hypothetical protein
MSQLESFVSGTIGVGFDNVTHPSTSEGPGFHSSQRRRDAASAEHKLKASISTGSSITNVSAELPN